MRTRRDVHLLHFCLRPRRRRDLRSLLNIEVLIDMCSRLRHLLLLHVLHFKLLRRWKHSPGLILHADSGTRGSLLEDMRLMRRGEGWLCSDHVLESGLELPRILTLARLPGCSFNDLLFCILLCLQSRVISDHRR